MKYKHYPIIEADKDFKRGQSSKYKVVTINWTFAGNDRKDKKVDYDKVHKNEYIWTPRRLIKYLKEQGASEAENMGWAEDIISIKPLQNVIDY